MKHTFILTLLLCLSNSVLFSQTEYFGILNPNGAVYIKLDSIPGIKWISVMPEFSTYDSENNRYFFRGADQNFENYFVTLDALTGEVLYQVPYPEFNNIQSNLVELRYCEADDKIYGLHWDADISQEYLATLDETTGEMTIVAEIPDVELIGVGLTAFDQTNAHFIFTGIAGGFTNIYTLDTSGNILASPLAPGGVGVGSYGYFFNNDDLQIYCIYWTDNGENRSIATIDPLSGVVTPFLTIENCAGISFGLSAYCESTNTYTFAGINQDGISTIYIADLDAGTYAVADEWLPSDLNAGDNIIEFEYDRDSGVLYALHWESFTPVAGVESSSNSSWLVYPNPTQESITVQGTNVGANCEMRILDCTGRIVQQTLLTQSIMNIDVSTLRSGIYHLELYTAERTIYTQKLVVR